MKPTTNETIASALCDAWSAVERVLSGNLGAVLGITYSEYRLLGAIAQDADADADAGASRVEIAQRVGLTPSAVTRAIRPLTSIGLVESVSHPRDARKSIAKLTTAGLELFTNATDVVDGVTEQIEGTASTAREHRESLLVMLAELAHV